MRVIFEPDSAYMRLGAATPQPYQIPVRTFVLDNGGWQAVKIRVFLRGFIEGTRPAEKTDQFPIRMIRVVGRAAWISRRWDRVRRAGE